MKILSKVSENTINILSDLFGVDRVKQEIPELDIVKSASDQETDTQDVLSKIASSKEVNVHGLKSHASVLTYDEAFIKNSEKELIDRTTDFASKQFELFGIKHAQMTPYNVKLSRIERSGIGVKKYPVFKDASICYKVSNTSFGPANIAYIKVSMKDNKIVYPQSIVLNKNHKFAFSNEGLSGMLKQCFAPEETFEDDGQNFVVAEFKEFPNVGKQLIYHTIGKYANYFELQNRLKAAGYIVVPKYDLGGYEVIPDKTSDIKPMIKIIKECGVPVKRENGKSAEWLGGTENKETRYHDDMDASETQSAKVKDNDTETLGDSAFGKETTKEAMDKKAEEVITPGGPSMTKKQITGQTGNNSPAKKETALPQVKVPGGKTQTVSDNKSKPTEGGKGNDSALQKEFVSGEDGDGGEAPKMMHKQKNSQPKDNTKKPFVDNGKRKQTQSMNTTKPTEAYIDEGAEWNEFTSRPSSQDGSVPDGDKSSKDSTWETFQKRPSANASLTKEKQASGSSPSPARDARDAKDPAALAKDKQQKAAAEAKRKMEEAETLEDRNAAKRLPPKKAEELIVNDQEIDTSKSDATKPDTSGNNKGTKSESIQPASPKMKDNKGKSTADDYIGGEGVSSTTYHGKSLSSNQVQANKDENGNVKYSNSARLIAISDYKKKVASTWNVDVGVDDNRTRDKNLKKDVIDFFKEFHYLDEAADKFDLPRDDISRWVASCANAGYRIMNDKESKKEEDELPRYTRTIVGTIGKIKLVASDGEIPENQVDTKNTESDNKQADVKKN